METDASEQLDKICVIPHGLVSPSAPKLKKLHAYVELSPVFVDAELLFESKFANSDNNFWLDTAKVEQGLSRFSFMGGAEFGPEGYLLLT
jgi:para-aminobenzoate synthetase